MSNSPFPEEELADAKVAFAKAWLAEIRSSPFKPDPFKAVLRLWNEENGKLPRALWVAHSGKWHDDPEVLDAIEEMQDQEQEEIKSEKAAKIAFTKSDEFKETIRYEMIEAMRADMNNKQLEPKDRQGASDRLSKLMALDEKPNADDNTGKILGVIQHRLEPMNPDEFKVYARTQQAELQGELIELTASDVQPIH